MIQTNMDDHLGKNEWNGLKGSLVPKVLVQLFSMSLIHKCVTAES